MPENLKELREQRGEAIAEARRVLDQSKAAGNDTLTAEEQERYDNAMQRQADLSDRIQREEQLAEVERGAAQREAQREEERGGNPVDGEEMAMAAFDTYLRSGRVAGEGAEEFRNLQADQDSAGGYLQTPQQFVQELIKDLDNMVFLRGRATTYQVAMAQSLGAPYLESDPADADWTSELGTGSEDSSMSFGKRELYPHPLAKRIKVSKKLLRQGMLNPANLVRQRMAYKFGITEEKAFLTGTGANQPLGIFTASSNGISTSRDVSTGNTTTSIEFDGLMEAKYSLKAQYQGRSEWVFHRDGVKQVAKKKDGEGQYIWQPSTQAGEPDRLLGRPVIMSEYVPNTFTTGNYVGMLGDYSNYWIADALAMEMQRLEELYAETNQVGFIGRKETDGMPVLEESFARIKLA